MEVNLQYLTLFMTCLWQITLLSWKELTLTHWRRIIVIKIPIQSITNKLFSVTKIYYKLVKKLVYDITHSSVAVGITRRERVKHNIYSWIYIYDKKTPYINWFPAKKKPKFVKKITISLYLYSGSWNAIQPPPPWLHLQLYDICNNRMLILAILLSNTILYKL